VTREAEVAVFVVRRARREVLVLHRSERQGAYWHIVAGGIEPGETPADAARRELLEETALAVDDVGDALYVAYPLSTEPPERMHLYAPGLVEMPVHSFLVEAPDDWEPVLDWEHDRHRWCSPDEAATLFHWPETADSLRAHLRSVG
jgi:8-oxo-dGTP pyrophosphatase MutT (NUDIX family)